jgi:hypothetical protein
MVFRFGIEPEGNGTMMITTQLSTQQSTISKLEVHEVGVEFEMSSLGGFTLNYLEHKVTISGLSY